MITVSLVGDEMMRCLEPCNDISICSDDSNISRPANHQHRFVILIRLSSSIYHQGRCHQYNIQNKAGKSTETFFYILSEILTFGNISKVCMQICFLSPQIAYPQILGLIPQSQIHKFPRCANPQIANPQIYND